MVEEDDTNHFLEAISKYSDAEYLVLFKRLSSFTRRIVEGGRFVWAGVRGGRLPKGLTIQDIVCEAIEDAVAGDRRWNRAENATEYNFLCSVIASKVSHLATSAENRKTVTVATPDTESGEDWEPLEYLLASPEPSPAERLAATDLLGKFRAWLKNKGQDDEDLEYLIMAMEDGTAHRAEIAETLRISVRDVDNKRKRLERRIAEFRKGAKS